MIHDVPYRTIGLVLYACNKDPDISAPLYSLIRINECSIEYDCPSEITDELLHIFSKWHI